MCVGGGEIEDGIPDHWGGGSHCPGSYLGGFPNLDLQSVVINCFCYIFAQQHSNKPLQRHVNFVCRENITGDFVIL